MLPSVLINTTVKVCLSLTAFCLGVGAQGSKNNAGVMEQVQELARQHQSWGPALNSPGVTVETKELSRAGARGQTAVRYHLFIHGLAKDKEYSLVHWPLNGKISTVLNGGIRIGENDIVYTVEDGKPLDLILLAGLGEPKRFAIVSLDSTLRAMFLLVPHPIHGEDRGCTVEAELLTPDSEALFIRGSGYTPGAEVGFESLSEGERQTGKLKSDSEGSITTVILPYVHGKKRGKVQVRITAATCSPKVSVQWGKGTYKVQ